MLCKRCFEIEISNYSRPLIMILIGTVQISYRSVLSPIVFSSKLFLHNFSYSQFVAVFHRWFAPNDHSHIFTLLFEVFFELRCSDVIAAWQSGKIVIRAHISSAIKWPRKRLFRDFQRSELPEGHFLLIFLFWIKSFWPFRLVLLFKFNYFFIGKKYSAIIWDRKI